MIFIFKKIPFTIPQSYLEWAFETPSHAKLNDKQKYGLALDDYVKHQALRDNYSVYSRYATCDLKYGDLQIEIKSTSSKTYTFSNNEYMYLRKQVHLDKPYKIWFFTNDITLSQSTFIGSLKASILIENSLFKISDIDDSWYVELNHINLYLNQE